MFLLFVVIVYILTIKKLLESDASTACKSGVSFMFTLGTLLLLVFGYYVGVVEIVVVECTKLF